MSRNWMRLCWDTALLALEAQQVIAMRLAKLSLGGVGASRETNRMISEKIVSFGQAAIHVATGGSANSVVKLYRKKVRSNRKRLAR